MMELAARRPPVEITGRAEFTHVAWLSAEPSAAAVAGFRVTTENVGDVVRLCRRLDGIPLARRGRTELRGRA